MSKKMSLRVVGMSCPSCEQSIVRRLVEIPGIKHVAVDHKMGTVDVTVEGASLTPARIRSHLSELGFDSI